jgi:8-oxo-dGTP diphosphatase
MSNQPQLHVAVGVVVNLKEEILIARRAAHLHQGGLWEFPGGKVETGETVRQALHRELLEELDILVEHCSPLVQIAHDYGDKKVLLDVWRVDQFSGEPKGQQGQPLIWVPVAKLSQFEFPAANRPIIDILEK